jgi:hypothetical protein
VRPGYGTAFTWGELKSGASSVEGNCSEERKKSGRERVGKFQAVDNDPLFLGNRFAF